MEKEIKSKLIKDFIEEYKTYFERYMETINNNFNLDDSKTYNIDKGVRYYMDWWLDENIISMESLYNYPCENVRQEELEGILNYYRFLLKSSYDNNNMEALIDFLIGTPHNILDKLNILN